MEATSPRIACEGSGDLIGLVFGRADEIPGEVRVLAGPHSQYQGGLTIFGRVRVLHGAVEIDAPSRRYSHWGVELGMYLDRAFQYVHELLSLVSRGLAEFGHGVRFDAR